MEIAVAAVAIITLICGRSVCFEDPAKKQKKKTAKQAKRLGELLGDYLEQAVLQEGLNSKAQTKA